MAKNLDNPEIPRIGLGTWENTDPDQCAETVKNAIEMGYRHIDTAQLYGNESYVGEGISSAGVDRDELFVATKVSFKNCDYDEVLETTGDSLRKLGLDVLDLLYVHWPAGHYSAEETLPAFEALLEDGVIRHIGVSNFTIDLLDEARQVLDHSIYAHQFEMHPRLQQAELYDYGRDHDIHTVAYSPFRHGTIFDDPVLKDIADNHSATVAQVCLAWLLSKEVFPVPKATSEDHLRDNFKATEITLEPDEVAQIDQLAGNDRYIDPPFAPW